MGRRAHGPPAVPSPGHRCRPGPHSSRGGWVLAWCSVGSKCDTVAALPAPVTSRPHFAAILSPAVSPSEGSPVQCSHRPSEQGSGVVTDLTHGSPAPVTSTRRPVAHTDDSGRHAQVDGSVPGRDWCAVGDPGAGGRADRAASLPWTLGSGAKKGEGEVGMESQLPRRDE